MASFWLIKELFIVVLVCKLVVSFSVEPKYTKFQFEEQLLEKLIRFEIYFESIKKENSLLISEALDSINKTKQEMDKGIDIMSEIKRKGETKVVFNVYRTSAQTVSSNDPVIFDKVLQNEGNGYDVSTGIFTAPVSGIYQFNGHLCANKGSDLEYAIFVGSVKIVKGEFRAATDSDDEKCTSFSAAYIVKKSEAVKVTGYTASLDASSDDPLFFSGALIKEI